MNRVDVLIAVTYTALGGVVVLIIGALVASSTRSRGREPDTKRLAHHERTWFGIVVVLLVALLFATIFFTPYGNSSASTRQEVDVHAQQFAFVLDKTTVRVGEPVKFHLTSADVNHGFAVFNEDNGFLFQAQVMPGKTQDVVYTFKKPGTYRIVCFEYCGVGHDQMAGSFRARVQVTR
jgi:cytochrome c oxidase subunit 2